MENLDLVAQLSWAIVELSTPSKKPNNAQVVVVLEMALQKALLEQEKAYMLKQSLIRTAAVTGESATGGNNMPIALVAVVFWMGSLFAREAIYVSVKHHQDKAPVVTVANNPAVK